MSCLAYIMLSGGHQNYETLVSEICEKDYHSAIR